MAKWAKELLVLSQHLHYVTSHFYVTVNPYADGQWILLHSTPLTMCNESHV
jgi:hypothetical protein